jgi:hypothetical protein
LSVCYPKAHPGELLLTHAAMNRVAVLTPAEGGVS